MTFRGADVDNINDASMIEAVIKVLGCPISSVPITESREAVDGTLTHSGGDRYSFDVTTPPHTIKASDWDSGDIDQWDRVNRKLYIWIYNTTLTRTTTTSAGVDADWWETYLPVPVIPTAYSKREIKGGGLATFDVTYAQRTITLS